MCSPDAFLRQRDCYPPLRGLANEQQDGGQNGTQTTAYRATCCESFQLQLSSHRITIEPLALVSARQQNQLVHQKTPQPRLRCEFVMSHVGSQLLGQCKLCKTSSGIRRGVMDHDL